MRRVVAGRLIGMVVVVLLAGVIVGTQIPASAADTVTTTSTTTTSTTPSWFTFPRVELNAASCTAGSCVAVGEQDLSKRVAVPFAERLVGGVWQQDSVTQPSRTTMRASALNEISCWSATGCVAVGYFFPSCCDEKAFAEEFNGTSWLLERHLGPSGYQPNAVSCVSARFCMSVGGGGDRAPVEQWSGRRWLRDRTPDPNTDPNTDLESGQSDNLNAVSCADRHDCVAVGQWEPPSATRYRPLAEIYEYDTWVIASPTVPRELSYDLTSISCPTSTVCMAVGSTGPPPTPGHPNRRQPFAALWNGQRWISQRLPRPPGSSSLDSVSCASPRSCTAVGNLASSPASYDERWNGRTWTRQAIVIGPQTSDQQLIGFSCATSRTCTAAVWAWPQVTPIITQSGGSDWAVKTQP